MKSTRAIRPVYRALFALLLGLLLIACAKRPVEPDSIGIATMTADGTIVLHLRAEGPKGTIGEGELTYSKGHKDYESILKHLGGLKPGETKSVPPWQP